MNVLKQKQLLKRSHRISKACEICRLRKVKCSGGNPCSQCTKFDETCRYRALYRSPKNGGNSRPHTSESSTMSQDVDLPPFLSITKSSDDMSSMEYFGPASNFSFVNQLNHYIKRLSGHNGPIDEDEGLRKFGMNLMVLKNPVEEFDFTLNSISTSTLNVLLTSYLETWHVPCPLFAAEDLYTLSSQTWKVESASKHLKATLYLILSIGAACSYFKPHSDAGNTSTSASHPTLHLARGFFELSLRTVPDIFSEVSFQAARILLLMSLSACNLGDTAQSYLYCGYAVRVSVAMGLHKVTNFQSSHQHRVWTSIWQWENYWSFCVGRISCCREELPTPTVPKEAFSCSGWGEKNRFPINHEHMRLRVIFGGMCSKIHSQIYDSDDNLMTVLDSVEELSSTIDTEYFGSSDRNLSRSNTESGYDPTDLNMCVEWFWIRIYYLYLQMVINRPFLIFYAYLNNSKAEASISLKEKLKYRSNLCVQFAIDISKFIIGLNRKVRMKQPIFFICTYLESACTILLFFIVSNMACISDDLAKTIWDVLQDTCSFLSGSSGPYVGSIQIIANDALKSLNTILLSRKNVSESMTYFDKVMQKVVTKSRYNGQSNLECSGPYTNYQNDAVVNEKEKQSTETPSDKEKQPIATPSENNYPGLYEEPSLESANLDIEGFWKQTIEWISNN
ncbi:hypothetical protein CANARDRAFT_175747 [[Candida] arabinofermentans NRRL YB-2248]|uniref:Zn(2)-C6 fungal-type domain-containing protein n=1 Tax=[Candida] arabinofermentans NRRL YB-2248 TaxID=983967 RepID=A0A1E4T2N5_9ASCO|nr:hypothetical protein CANARDRAFT_175747 [[Candida] arabinofermentans NRRL YB-2248]